MNLSIGSTFGVENNRGVLPWGKPELWRPFRHLRRTRGWVPTIEDIPLVGWENSALFEFFNLQGSVNVTGQIEALLWHLAGEVEIPQLAEVRDYLLRYPDMMDALQSVCRTASEEFGACSRLSLEVYHDPEIEDEYLTLYVRQESYNEQILDRLEQIYAEYEEELAERSGWLLVTTDFRPLR